MMHGEPLFRGQHPVKEGKSFHPVWCPCVLESQGSDVLHSVREGSAFEL